MRKLLQKLFWRKNEKLILFVGENTNEIHEEMRKFNESGYETEFIHFPDEKVLIPEDIPDTDEDFLKMIADNEFFIVVDMNRRIIAIQKIRKSKAKYIITNLKSPAYRELVYSIAWNHNMIPFFWNKFWKNKLKENPE